MRPPKVTIGGAVCLATGAVHWTEVSGNSAPFVTFHVHRREWSRLASRMGQEVDFRIESDTAPSLVVRRLVLVHETHTSLPFTRAVVVSDQRVWWPYRLIHRDYNVVRKTGSRRLVGGEVIELAQSIDTFTYAKWSLDPSTGRRWTTRRFVEDVFGQIAASTSSQLIIGDLPQDDEADGVGTVQNVLLSENAASAAGRALGTIRGLAVTITKNGDVRLFDETDYLGAEDMLKGKTTTDRGTQVRRISLAGVRPARVSVYFEREVEVRFDSREEDESPPRYAPETIGGGDLLPLVDNVLPLPDPTTQIDGDADGWAQGAWATVKQAVDAWATQFPKIPGQAEVSLRSARANWWWLDRAWGKIGDAFPASAPASWMARTSTFMNHYRRTYRIPRDWMDNIREVRGYRVSILDPVTRTRGPAQAWGTYCVIPSSKYQLQTLDSGDEAFVAQNIDGYPGIDGELWTKPASPCVVSVVDPHLGVLSLQWQVDPYGLNRAIHPSMYVPLGGGQPTAPSRDFREPRQAWDGIPRSTVPLVLADDHRVAMLVTCIPGSPNDKGRLFRIDVDPVDVADRLAGGGVDPSGGAGPTFEVYVPPQLVSAWYAWRTTREARSTARVLFGLDPSPSAFGDGGGGGGPAGPVPPPAAPGGGGFAVGGSIIRDFLDGLNADPQDGYEIVNHGTESVLQAVAEAMAIRVWSAYADGVTGSPAYHLDPRLEPRGNVHSVSHGVMMDGALLTSVDASANRPPYDPLAFVPVPMRSLLIHRVPDGTV
ncbi:MAG: hypothetical protein AB7T63_14910 [Planctomycetota bacterium]